MFYRFIMGVLLLWNNCFQAQSFNLSDFSIFLEHTSEEIINSPELLARCKELSSELRDEDGNTGFMWACEHHESLALNMLEMHDVLALPINHQNNFGDTACMLACCRNQQQLVAKMFEMHHPLRLEINAEDSGGDTAFMQACIQNNRRIVDLFLGYYDRVPFDVNKKNKAGVSAFVMSCFHSDANIVFKIIENGRKLRLNLMLESYENQPIALWLYLEQKINILEKMIDCCDQCLMTVSVLNHDNSTLFMLASKFQPTLALKMLEKHNTLQFEVNSQDNFGNTAFILACENNPEVALKMLEMSEQLRLQETINMRNKFGDTAFIWTCFKNPKVALKMLEMHECLQLEANAVNLDGETAFMKACRNNNTYIALAMLEMSEQLRLQETVNMRNKFGDTAFIWACCQNQEVALKMLEKHKQLKLHINTTNHDKSTGFWFACEKNYKAVALKMLELCESLKLKLMVSAVNINGDTAFILACENNPEVALKMLEISEQLRLKEAVNMSNKFGDTAFMWACYKNKEVALKMLEMHEYLQLEVNVVSKHGYTAFIRACENNPEVALKMLEMSEQLRLKETVNMSNKLGDTAFIWACYKSPEIALKMLDMHEQLGLNMSELTEETLYKLLGNVSLCNPILFFKILGMYKELKLHELLPIVMKKHGNDFFMNIYNLNKVLSIDMLIIYKEFQLNLEAMKKIRELYEWACSYNVSLALQMLIMKDSLKLSISDNMDCLLELVQNLCGKEMNNGEALYMMSKRCFVSYKSMLHALTILENNVPIEAAVLVRKQKKMFLEFWMMQEESGINKINQIKDCADTYGSLISKKTVNMYMHSLNAIPHRLTYKNPLTFEDHIILGYDTAVESTLEDSHMCKTLQLYENKEFEKLYYKVLLMCYMPHVVQKYCQQLKVTGSIGKVPLLNRLFDADTYCDPIIIPNDALDVVKGK